MNPAERRAIRRLLDAVLSISSELSLPVVLHRVVEAAVDLIDVRYAALGLLDSTGTRIGEFLHVGFDDATVARIGDPPEGRGILGLLITDPRPLRLDDLTTHPESCGLPEHHPPMTNFLGVPIRVRGEVFGHLYLCDKTDGSRFTEDDEELIQGLAAAAGVAIENARLHTRVSELSVLEDRERIARDLHDTVIQRLFATGMTLQAAAAKVVKEEVAEYLQTAVDDLDDTVRHIRSTIFELQQKRLPGRSVRQELLDLIAEAADVLGTDPLVHFEGPIDATLDQRLADHLLAATREALTNVVKHAQSPRLEVAVSVKKGELGLLVLDEGIGIPDEPDGKGHGLGNLQSRAAELGGDCSIERRPTGGTCVEWRVPLPTA